MGLIDLDASDDESCSPASFAVDLVFVHGLHERGLEAWIDPKSGVLWMRDLFPHDKYKARRLIYEYDGERLMAPGSTAANSIYDEAVSLVNHLVADRELQGSQQRPIIFFCHEFGGLLVKRALAYSHSRSDIKLEHIRSVFRSTIAILFLSTPHQGFGKEPLIFALRTSHPGPSQFILSLLKGSETLQEITDQFAPLMKYFFIYNFWEQVQTSTEQGPLYVVDRFSAAPAWSDVDQCGINATHSSMVKFGSPTAPGYRLILAALDKYIKLAPATSAKRWQQDFELVQKGREHEAENILQPLGQGHAGSSDPTARSSPRDPAPESPSSKTPRASAETLADSDDSGSDQRSTPYVNVHYLVRRRPDYFVGRQRQADLLKKSFGTVRPRDGRKPKVFVIHGLPGSGKTQFCLHYLEENRHKYWGVFWIDSTTEATADDGFAALGQQAGKGAEPVAGQLWLSQAREPWLLVLDNANDPDMPLSNILPVSGNGHILITTRNPGAILHNTAGFYQFGGMDPEEAVAMLLRLAYPENELRRTFEQYGQHAQTIASELGYLALALKQAAYTIRKQFLPLDRYLKSLLGCRKALLSRPMVKSAADANIISTWELPFTGISNGKTVEYRDAVDLVHIFAFMHFVSIPSNIFTLASDGLRLATHLSVRPPALVEPTSMQMVGDRVLTAARVLYEHSIISISELEAQPGEAHMEKSLPRRYFTLHPAIHQWARERLGDKQQRTWLDCTAAILEQSISTNMETSGRFFRRLLLPHIESCLALLESAYPNLPETSEQARHLERFGLVYAEAGLWRKARSLQLRVAKFRMRRLGKRHSATIAAQKSLANTYWNLFEIKSCLEVQRDILMTQMWSRQSVWDWMCWPPWKPDHTPYCVTLDELTRSLWLAGMRDLSRRTGERAVDGLTRRLGPDDPQTLNAMFNLARTYLHLGEHAKSYELITHVLDRREHFFGPDHPDTLMAQNELGISLCAQKTRLDEAERLVRSTFETRRRVLGEEHAYTLWSANDLSKVLCERHRFEEARSLLEEAAPIAERTLGPDHAGTNMTKSNLARVYVLTGEWERAARLFEDLEAVMPRDHPDYIHLQWGRAFVLLNHHGDLEEAERRCDWIMERVRQAKTLTLDSARVISTAEILLRIYEVQDRDAEILELKRRFPRLGSGAVKSSVDCLPLENLRRRWTEEHQRAAEEAT